MLVVHMADQTEIAWADSTFNPWIGCTKVGPGCDNCYAKADFDDRKHRVVWGPGQARSRTAPANWKKPLQWNKEAPHFHECGACGMRWHSKTEAGRRACPSCGSSEHHVARRRVFCASLADVFDNEIDSQWRRDLFDLIRTTPNLDWLLLTKRIGNAVKMLPWASDGAPGNMVAGGMVYPNVWLGATIVNQEEADRDIPKLLEVPAAKRFLSMEPLLGPVDLTQVDDGAAHRDVPREEWGTVDDEDSPPGLWWNVLTGQRTIMHGGATGDWSRTDAKVDWVIVGGESGPNARPMHPDWVRSLRDQCAAAGVPFFFKQHGEWLATEFCDDDMAMIPSKRTVYVGNHGSFHDGTGGVDFFGGDQETAWVGKKAAGRLLDGRTWDEVPA